MPFASRFKERPVAGRGWVRSGFLYISATGLAGTRIVRQRCRRSPQCAKFERAIDATAMKTYVREQSRSRLAIEHARLRTASRFISMLRRSVARPTKATACRSHRRAKLFN